jgi:hypothetical protein
MLATFIMRTDIILILTNMLLSLWKNVSSHQNRAINVSVIPCIVQELASLFVYDYVESVYK